MNYFIGFGGVDTEWGFPDMLPEESGVVFLIDWGRASAVLVGLFTFGEMKAYVSPPARVEPAVSYRVPSVPVSEQLLPELAQMGHQKVEKDSRVHELQAISDQVGRALLTFAEEYVKIPPFGKRQTREKKEKRQKTEEDFFEALEKSADKRIGQGRFRDELFRAYQDRCAISKCSINEVLSAAHIWDYSQSGCQEVWNGILLRADIHLLFDRHLLRIFPGNPPFVVLDPGIRESEQYKGFHLQPLRLPNPFDERTNAELLRRWDAANRVFGEFLDLPKG